MVALYRRTWPTVRVRRAASANSTKRLVATESGAGLFVRARGVLKQELIAHLVTKRTMRRAKPNTRAGQGRGRIIDAVSIPERPAEAEDRAVPGRWEGDLLAGANNTHLATLVERHSQYVMLAQVEGKDTETVVRAITRSINTLPEQLCPPSVHHSHQRGRVPLRSPEPVAAWLKREDQRVVRQYFPHGMVLSGWAGWTIGASMCWPVGCWPPPCFCSETSTGHATWLWWRWSLLSLSMVATPRALPSCF